MAVTAPTIRALEASDDHAVLALAQGLPKWFTPQGLADMRRDLGVHEGFVAVHGGRVVGFATWCPMDSEVAALSWIGVAEEDHHHGVGTALLAAVKDSARRRGHRVLEVSTVADNVDYAPYAATRRFYRARGFVDYRVDPGFYGEGDDRYDRLLLRSPL